MKTEFATQPPTRRTIARIRDKFGADGTVHDVHKQRSGRPRIATSPASSAVVLQHFTQPRFRHQFPLPFESCLKMRDFTYNKMVLHLTTIDMSGLTWITPYLDDG
jgi:hypothetical protein